MYGAGNSEYLAFLKSAQKSWDFQRHQLVWRFPKMGGTQKSMVYSGKSINGWFGGTPISGNLQFLNVAYTYEVYIQYVILVSVYLVIWYVRPLQLANRTHACMIQNLSTGFCRRNNNTDCTTNVVFSKMHVFVHYICDYTCVHTASPGHNLPSGCGINTELCLDWFCMQPIGAWNSWHSHTHTNGLQQAHNRFPANLHTDYHKFYVYEIIFQSFRHLFFLIFAMFLFNSQAAGHPRDAARWKGVPVSSSKPRSCGTSWGLEWVSSMASWLESHEVVGKHGKTWENMGKQPWEPWNSGNIWKTIPCVCVRVCVLYSWLFLKQLASCLWN